MTEYETHRIEANSIEELVKVLRVYEKSKVAEIVNLGSLRSNTDPGEPGVNFLEKTFNRYSSSLPLLELEDLSEHPFKVDSADGRNHLREKLKTNLSVFLGDLYISGKGFVPALLTRPGRIIRFQGAMSTFGGKDDPGVDVDEELAIVRNDNFDYYKKYFIDEAKGGDKPMAKNLNRDRAYIACRWEYGVTPRTRLKDCRITVTNPTNGVTKKAEAVDFGPAANLNRVADLSPGLAEGLGLKTDQECIVEMLIPPDLAAKASSAVELPPADGVKLLTETEVINSFGNPNKTTYLGKGKVKPTAGFTKNNMSLATVPVLSGVAGGPESGKVYCNNKVKNYLEAAFAEIAKRDDLNSLLITWDGMYNPRHMLRKPNLPLSRHTWAIAFDINAAYNGYGKTPAPQGKIGSVIELVPIFEKYGFYWGGRFSTPDGMHFEFGQAI